jgi:DNA-binding PadR family transcriptional regulator
MIQCLCGTYSLAKNVLAVDGARAMVVKSHPLGLPARHGQITALLDEPPVGHLQALVLHKLDRLGKNAYGYKVLEGLSIDSGVWIDHVQIYTTIRKLLDKELIELAETRPQKGGPPVKVYKLTAAGRAALKAVTAHHTALADQLNDKRKATRT